MNMVLSIMYYKLLGCEILQKGKIKTDSLEPVGGAETVEDSSDSSSFFPNYK